ncbi:Peptide ABC transporter permease [Magnetospirillum sp. XM-1]|uniref:ABC transporter permease n=1 Tax=Magnetospirillum sp. XM-1 TaxID=1663591 RepID=UPI00073DEF11|nr:ABC transporter permease [Magnetospirillum sp. XM-1]CUW40367.1 Peptide ABC transporter permease [Magnetospirillum sp. XM-1]
MNLALRDIRHKLGRFLLTCLGLALLLGVVLSMIGIYRGLVEDALSLVRAPAADLWVVEAGSRGPFAEASRMPGDTREMVARVPGVADAGSVTYQTVETAHGDRKLRLQVVGYEPGRMGGPAGIEAGRAIAVRHGEAVADRRAGLALGEHLRLGRDEYLIVGLTRNHVSTGGDPVLFLSLRDAQDLQFLPKPATYRRDQARGAPPPALDTINAVVARLDSGMSADRVAHEIWRWKHLGTATQGQQESILVESVVEKARRQIGLFTAILMVVSAVVIALIIYTMTMDKTREIATLKLIGAPDRTIVGLILQQALAMGLIGFSMGAILVNLVADRFPRRVVLQAEDALMLAGLVLVVCVLSSGLGVRLALRIEPAAALGG